MKSLRLMWVLWKLARKLEDARAEYRAAALMIVVERGASLEARGNGAIPRTGCEVSYWHDRDQAMTGTRTKRGHDLATALRAALREA